MLVSVLIMKGSAQKWIHGKWPKGDAPGDEVCVLFGGTPLYILRPMADYDVFVGDTYLND
jgi:hypothetical protein